MAGKLNSQKWEVIKVAIKLLFLVFYLISKGLLLHPAFNEYFSCL